MAQMETAHTFLQGSLAGVVSSDRSAARRPWTVIGSSGSEILFGTVYAVRSADRGTVTSLEPAWIVLLKIVLLLQQYWH